MVQVRGSCTLEDGSPLEDTLEDTLEGRVSGRRMELGRVWGRRGGSGGGCSVIFINQSLSHVPRATCAACHPLHYHVSHVSPLSLVSEV